MIEIEYDIAAPGMRLGIPVDDEELKYLAECLREGTMDVEDVEMQLLDAAHDHMMLNVTAEISNLDELMGYIKSL